MHKIENLVDATQQNIKANTTNETAYLTTVDLK